MLINEIMTDLFFISFFLIIYTIIGYPLLMFFWGWLNPKPINVKEQIIPLSIILCARNESTVIRSKLKNLLGVDYPSELIEIIVISDGSTDGTNEIVRTFEEQNVRLISLELPSGKANALNIGVAAASHEIMLFCDARQQFASDVVRRLVAYFADDTIGAVSGRLIIVPEASSAAGEGIGRYWNYEVWLRCNESRSGSVIGVTGAIYAMCRSLYQSLPEGTILDDVLIPMQIIKQNRRVLYDNSVYAFDSMIVTDSNELARKVRTLYGNLQLIQIEPSLFLPWENPVWFQFISHKIIRLFLPLLLASCLLTCLFRGGWLLYVGFAQLLFWLSAIICLYLNSSRSLCRLSSAFLLLNTAVCLAWLKWITQKGDAWGQVSSSWKE